MPSMGLPEGRILVFDIVSKNKLTPLNNIIKFVINKKNYDSRNLYGVTH